MSHVLPSPSLEDFLCYCNWKVIWFNAKTIPQLVLQQYSYCNYTSVVQACAGMLATIATYTVVWSRWCDHGGVGKSDIMTFILERGLTRRGHFFKPTMTKRIQLMHNTVLVVTFGLPAMWILTSKMFLSMVVSLIQARCFSAWWCHWYSQGVSQHDGVLDTGKVFLSMVVFLIQARCFSAWWCPWYRQGVSQHGGVVGTCKVFLSMVVSLVLFSSNQSWWMCLLTLDCFHCAMICSVLQMWTLHCCSVWFWDFV